MICLFFDLSINLIFTFIEFYRAGDECVGAAGGRAEVVRAHRAVNVIEDIVYASLDIPREGCTPAAEVMARGQFPYLEFPAVAVGLLVAHTASASVESCGEAVGW